jgi:hypothetical protein
MEEKQKTPKPEEYEIPIPKRADVFKVLKKAATHQVKVGKKSNTSRSPKK